MELICRQFSNTKTGFIYLLLVLSQCAILVWNPSFKSKLFYSLSLFNVLILWIEIKKIKGTIPNA